MQMQAKINVNRYKPSVLAEYIVEITMLHPFYLYYDNRIVTVNHFKPSTSGKDQYTCFNIQGRVVV